MESEFPWGGNGDRHGSKATVGGHEFLGRALADHRRDWLRQERGSPATGGEGIHTIGADAIGHAVLSNEGFAPVAERGQASSSKAR